VREIEGLLEVFRESVDKFIDFFPPVYGAERGVIPPPVQRELLLRFIGFVANYNGVSLGDLRPKVDPFSALCFVQLLQDLPEVSLEYFAEKVEMLTGSGEAAFRHLDVRGQIAVLDWVDKRDLEAPPGWKLDAARIVKEVLG
jgi:hypothetical protein